MVGSAGLGAGLVASAGIRSQPAHAADTSTGVKSVSDFGVQPNVRDDQTKLFQKAIDTAAAGGFVLHVPAGTFHTGTLELRTGSHLSGIAGQSIFKVAASGTSLEARDVSNVRVCGLVFDGSSQAPAVARKAPALLVADTVKGLSIRDCKFSGGAASCISLSKCSGQVTDNDISEASEAGLFCIDSMGLEISHNRVHGCRNNGIQVWRSKSGEDGTIISSNRIEAIGAADGGSGQNGNGINVFRAGSVQVTGNRITDCVFSAIRGNTASNFQVVGNNCSRLGEVAIYAEFGFEGTVIANNLVDRAATGISVTNFNEGGRMAVVQGNLIRNLFLRDGERGVGIAVEADSMVSGNVVEGAPGGGIMVGWGRYLRDVNVSGNLVREARVGIGISAAHEAGYAYVTNNMLSVTAEGGIRAMDHKKLLGPDLAKTSSESYRNMAVFGNVSL